MQHPYGRNRGQNSRFLRGLGGGWGGCRGRNRVRNRAAGRRQLVIKGVAGKSRWWRRGLYGGGTGGIDAFAISTGEIAEQGKDFWGVEYGVLLSDLAAFRGEVGVLFVVAGDLDAIE